MAKKAKPNGHGRQPLYASYVFKDKEPAIDELRTVVEDYFGRRVNGHDLAEITEAGGPSVGCMRGWFFGATKRPTNATIEAAGRALGFQRKWVRMRSNSEREK